MSFGDVEARASLAQLHVAVAGGARAREEGHVVDLSRLCGRAGMQETAAEDDGLATLDLYLIPRSNDKARALAHSKRPRGVHVELLLPLLPLNKPTSRGLTKVVVPSVFARFPDVPKSPVWAQRYENGEVIPHCMRGGVISLRPGSIRMDQLPRRANLCGDHQAFLQLPCLNTKRRCKLLL